MDIVASDFCAGMFVRAPRDIEETPLEGEYRDFWLGQIVSIDQATETVVIQFLEPFDDHRMRSLQESYALNLLTRAAIAPNAKFIKRNSPKWGRVLIPSDPKPTSGKLRTYFVQLGDEVTALDESDMHVAYQDQAPDPASQIANYEFHHPLWQTRRDSLLKSYAALQTVTYGIEELVGARVLLLAHQAEIVARILGDHQVRYLLADEVGLGKTIEACVILKGLMRRHPQLKTLIVVPEHLTQQWYNELNFKFWSRFKRASSPTGDFEVKPPGLVVSHKALAEKDSLWRWLSRQSWDLLIVDEVHHATRNSVLYERLYALSERAARALMLSATPVEHRAKEYLQLLKLINPAQYHTLTAPKFERMLEAQSKIRNTIALHSKALTVTVDDFDPIEFQDDMAGIVTALEYDTTLANLAKQVNPHAHDRGLDAARETMQYVAENYRIESRVIRNRRANLQIELPMRQVNRAYAYVPSLLESDTLEALHDYTNNLMRNRPGDVEPVRLSQQLFYAAFSSPAALVSLLGKAPPVGMGLRDQVLHHARRWDDEAKTLLENIAAGTASPDSPDRLVRVLQAIEQARSGREWKVLVFSGWDDTLERLQRALVKRYGNHAVAVFKRDMNSLELQAAVDRFQSDVTCHILLSDESGGEGRNFQFAQQIIHVDLPWSPARVEQRIGRVDRLGRTGVVWSIVPFAQDTLEHDLFRLWQDAFQLFEQSISGLEIVLEEIQDQLVQAFASSTREGLAGLFPKLVREASRLRAQVEEERYFEQAAIDYRRRDEFQDISAAYSDGEKLRRPLLRWAEMMGLPHHYYPKARLATFDRQEVNKEHLHNAKVAYAPSMGEALRRGRDPNAKILKGTFDRTYAVQREDIIFFAPGEDWTDMILNHALQADRGGCSAILRSSTAVTEEWCGFQFLFRLSIDPRPLLELGYNPTHLLRAKGYLASTMKDVVITVDGEIVKASDPIAAVLQQPISENDKHMGRRGDAANILKFKRKYPPKVWRQLVARALDVADSALKQELRSMQELANQANADFARDASGQRAANRWRNGIHFQEGNREIQEFEKSSNALVQGISQPWCQLESVRFWIVKPRGRHA